MMMHRCLGLVVLTLIPVVASAADVPRTLTVMPTRVLLDGPRSQQRIVVVADYGTRSADLSRKATYTSSDPKIVRIDAGVARPVGDGTATLTVQADGKTSTLAVEVRNATKDVPVDFSREIVPLLTKLGCNSGACHGAQHGRGGFRLSLFGFDPAFDHPQIVQSAEGRRIVPSDPERSILLLKPILAMEHGGGERLKAKSQEYELLKQWLADGVPAPTAKDASVTKLEVLPARRVLEPGEQQQILVQATWSDGLVTDVTTVAQYDALNEAVASVTADGLVTAKERGETHIMIRFGGQASVVQITLPYTRLTKPLDFPTANFIDEKLKAKWQDLGLTPSELCSDEVFLRRLYLDTIGTLPTPAEVRTFLADKNADKRKQAIDKVLDRPEFVDFWSYKWGDLLRINRDALQDKGMWSFHNWVRAAMRDNMPLDKMVREIITAEGSTFTDGPANYYRLSATPADRAETTAQLFLGVRIQCARCHHHPFEKWSQDDYYGMAAFFVRLGTKNSQEFGIFGRESVVFLRDTGEQTHPRTGRVVPPHPLDGANADDPFDRRRPLADWVTAKENPFFARNLANRFWAYLMGHGLVEPIDDMRATNPASNPELLDALAADLVKHQFDLKHLLRTILNARAYQLSSLANEGNLVDAANIHHTRYAVRRLTAEQMADAIDFATGTREKYVGLPLGTRAIQLPDTKVRSFLMDVFGRPARQITCECERSMQPNIAQALHLLNGDFLNRKMALATGRLETMLTRKTPLPEMIDEIYLVSVSRPPTSKEKARAQEWIGKAPSLREGVNDLLWVLMNSREFQFNH